MDALFSMVNKKDDQDDHPNEKDETTVDTSPNPTSTKLQHHASNSELLSSAKIVADAAKSSFNHEPNKVLDKGKVADAAGDLLDAASHRSKFEESKYGEYVEKAEDYLHNYGSKQSKTSTTSTTDTQGHKETTVAHTETEVHSGDGDNQSGGGGSGGYLKMAQGFMK